jgi:hypothetical protein
MQKYIDGTEIKVGDIFTDGTNNHQQIRLKNRAIVLYVDKFNLVWFPLNDFTTHTDFKKEKWTSRTWRLAAEPKKVEIEELTEEELKMYNSVDMYIKQSGGGIG